MDADGGGVPELVSGGVGEDDVEIAMQEVVLAEVGPNVLVGSAVADAFAAGLAESVKGVVVDLGAETEGAEVSGSDEETAGPDEGIQSEPILVSECEIGLYETEGWVHGGVADVDAIVECVACGEVLLALSDETSEDNYVQRLVRLDFPHSLRLEPRLLRLYLGTQSLAVQPKLWSLRPCGF